jgi:hypothetical protein
LSRNTLVVSLDLAAGGATIAALLVSVVALFGRFLRAVSTFLAGTPSDRTVEAVLDLAIRAAAVALLVVGVVAFLVFLDISVATPREDRTRPSRCCAITITIAVPISNDEFPVSVADVVAVAVSWTAAKRRFPGTRGLGSALATPKERKSRQRE